MNDLDRTLTPVHITIDGVVLATAGLGDRVRDDALDSLQQLRGRGWRTVMLSGDTHDVDASVARALAVEAQDSIGAVSPQSVLAFIERPNAASGHFVVMVG